MNVALKINKPAESAVPENNDRPGWIPPEIKDDWDTNPYAYQTEEELMPAGGLHGRLLAYILEILRNFIEAQGLMLLADTFMLYRDSKGTKRRISPDLLLMPFRFPPPSAYDLEIEPPPLCVAEITSPKSRLNDLKNKLAFYTSLGIQAYLAIDAVTPKAQLRERIQIHLWRKTGENIREIMPDEEGYLTLPEMNMKLKSEKQQIIFRDAVSGEILHDTGQLRTIAESALKKAEKERKTAESALKKAEKEWQRAETTEKAIEESQKLIEKLVRQLKELGVEPDL